MRDLRKLDHLRDVDAELRIYGIIGNDTCGLFRVGKLDVIASSGGTWDHVSVSLPDRCPTWEEMETIKRQFFQDDETVMQLHVPVKDHIPAGIDGNLGGRARFCLHLWRPQNVDIPRPPIWMLDVVSMLSRRLPMLEKLSRRAIMAAESR